MTLDCFIKTVITNLRDAMQDFNKHSPGYSCSISRNIDFDIYVLIDDVDTMRVVNDIQRIDYPLRMKFKINIDVIDETKNINVSALLKQ